MMKDTFMGRSIYPVKKRTGAPIGSRVFPVKSGRSRLRSTVFKDVEDAFRELFGWPGDLFDGCCYQLLENYAGFVQLIPEHEDLPMQSMLGNSLKRSYVVTKEFMALMQIKEGKRFLTSPRGSRLLFAVFSASLLFRVAKIMADKQIVLCDEKGQFICQWQYFEQSMMHCGQYFKMRYGGDMPGHVVADMTVLLAKQLMPPLGFAWLVEDKTLLGHWFKALNIHDELFGIHQMGLDVDYLMRKSQFDFTVESDHFISDATLIGEQFWEWMLDQMSSIEDGNTMDRDGIGLVDGELLFDVDRYAEAYARLHNISSASVLDQLERMGVVDTSNGKFVCRHLSSAKASGVVSSGLYAQTNRADQLDAKRFVGVDASIASACIRSYNGLEEQDALRSDHGIDAMYTRLLGMFLGNLTQGLNLSQKGGL